MRSHESSDAVAANTIARAGSPSCSDVNLHLDARRVAVQIPMGFTEMLVDHPALALEWRMATREIFTTYFARGYKAVDFILDRGEQAGGIGEDAEGASEDPLT